MLNGWKKKVRTTKAMSRAWRMTLTRSQTLSSDLLVGSIFADMSAITASAARPRRAP